MPTDLQLTLTFFKNLGYHIDTPLAEKEGKTYAAHHFTLNHYQTKFRSAKITPNKAGQFVTLWKRVNYGSIQAFDYSDAIDLIIISVRKDEKFGLFIFPKSILIEQGIISHLKKEGKRAFRIYPPWDKNLNLQATKSQIWQLKCFIDLANPVYRVCHKS